MTEPPFPFHGLSLEAIRPLLTPPNGNCVSLYLPTHRRPPDNAVDLPTYRQLVHSIRRRLEGSLPRARIDRLLAPLDALATHPDFWAFTRDGLAVFAAAKETTGFRLPQPVAAAAFVGPRFQTLPLVRQAMAAEMFELLVLSSETARVYAGRAVDGEIASLEPLLLHPGPGAGESRELLAREDVVTEEVREPHRALPLRTEQVNLHGGLETRQADERHDTTIFLRYVDQCLDHPPYDHGPPLVLAAHPRLAARFRRLSRSRRLLESGIDGDLHLASPTDLAEACRPVLRALRQRRIDQALASFGDQQPRGLASAELSSIAQAAVAGRVATLAIEAGRSLPGRFDRTTGRIEPVDTDLDTDLERPPAAGGPARAPDDVLADIVETVVLHRGDVVTLPAGLTAVPEGVFAVYRY